jgi:hypothetical protein
MGGEFIVDGCYTKYCAVAALLHNWFLRESVDADY